MRQRRHLHHRPKRRYCFFGSRNRHTCSAIHRVPDPFRQLSRLSSFRWICRNRPQPQSNPVPIRLRLHVKMMPKSAPERQKQLTLMSDITLCALQYSLQNIQISNSEFPGAVWQGLQLHHGIFLRDRILPPIQRHQLGGRYIRQCSQRRQFSPASSRKAVYTFTDIVSIIYSLNERRLAFRRGKCCARRANSDLQKHINAIEM